MELITANNSEMHGRWGPVGVVTGADGFPG
jgi:hypothetical protein